MVRRPYTELPTRKVFANPILLLLNLIHQFEKTFTQESIQEQEVWSSRTMEEWKDWIMRSSKLKHLVGQRDLDPLTNEAYCSVDGLAHALVVASHLRRRLPQEFQWVTEKDEPDDDSNIFSDRSTPSQDASSSARRGPRSHSPRSDRSRGSGSGRRVGRSGPLSTAQTGEKRKQAEEQTDCTAIVKEWRGKNSKSPQTFWRKPHSSSQSNGNVDGNSNKMVPTSADHSAWGFAPVRGGGLSIRKVFGVIVNRIL